MQIFQKNEDSASPKKGIEQLPMEALVQLVLLGEDHSGRDELNLAGNPFALLQPAHKSSQNVLSREFERTLPDGRTVTARWEVAGHPKLGLPGPLDEVLLLVLLQLTREAGEGDGAASWPRTVHFSRYDLLRRLGWGDTTKGYRALTEAFTRLVGVTISARYAFFDAATKLPVADANFGLLDSSDIVDEPRGRKGDQQLPLSSFTWSERMHESFLAGNVRSLALEFVLRLDLPLSRRLFRFLDAMRCAQKPARREFAIAVMNLRDRLGMTPYAYASKVKEKLAGAHEELQGCGYLESVEYRKGATGDLLVCYRFGDPANPRSVALAPKEGQKDEGEELQQDVGDSAPLASGLQGAVETILAWDWEDEEVRGLACDQVFHALEQAERDAIDAWAWEQMPPFLRANRSTEGARNTLKRSRRQRVLSDHGDEVRALLEEAARAEVGVPEDEQEVEEGSAAVSGRDPVA